jgi:hypothetical protein
MKRTVLYYPTISVPSGAWLRRALFYFDEIASIVPSTLDFTGELGPSLVPVSEDVLFLESEGAFRRMAPDNLWMRQDPNNKRNPQPIDEWQRALDFQNEFLSTVDKWGFFAVANGHWERIHRGKMAEMILTQLRNRGLIKPEMNSQSIGETDWFLVEENTARLYMAMLAQCMADLDTEHTVPGTDSAEEEDFLYRARSGDGFPCMETRFLRAVPTPRDDVALADILDFKRRREAELLEYRVQVDQLQATLSEAETNSHLKHALVKFEENQRKALLNLSAAMADARLGTFWGSLKTLVKTSKPALWATAAAALYPHVPEASVALAGVAVAGTIETSTYFVDRRNEKRANARSFPFSYVQHAQEEHIL